MKKRALFLVWFFSFSLLPSVPIHAQITGNLVGTIERPLRYQPVGTDFVIENGREFFNRPLYGGNTAFRVDAGDKPEFTLYLPGRGGNLRFGIKTANSSKWLHDADRIVARYRPGSMVYEVRDSLLGKGVLKLTVLAMYDREGLLTRVELEGTSESVSWFGLMVV